MIVVYPNLKQVEEASAWLRRLYRVIRETMRATAGRLSGVGDWPAKKLLGHHLWLDACHADSLRQRVLELRFPRVDVDLDVDQALLAVLDKLPSTLTDAEFLAGVYRVVKPTILTAVLTYLNTSDSLDDAPSHRFLHPMAQELEQQLRAFEPVWRALPETDRRNSQPWEDYLREALAQAGGVLGRDTGAPLANRPGFSDRARYTIPRVPKRDSRWLPAVTQVPPRPPRTPQEQQIWVAIDHVNELWAAELAAAFIWHYEGMPWELYAQTARWAFDELRHAMMGERRLVAYGFEVGIDVPMVPDHWLGIAQTRGLEAMLFTVHGLEQNGPRWKAQLKRELWQMGDPYTAQDCDYDWADEAGHIQYGQSWIKALFPKLTKSEVVARTQREVELWKQWIADRHASGQHGYDVFLPRIEAKCARMPSLAHPEFFVPLGSSAAAASYAQSA